MSTTLLEELTLDAWNPVLTAPAQAAAINTLEAGRILYLPRLAFALLPHEQRFLSPEWSHRATKNINFRSDERRLPGARGGGAARGRAKPGCCARCGGPGAAAVSTII